IALRLEGGDLLADLAARERPCGRRPLVFAGVAADEHLLLHPLHLPLDLLLDLVAARAPRSGAVVEAFEPPEREPLHFLGREDVDAVLRHPGRVEVPAAEVRADPAIAGVARLERQD